MFGVNLLDMKVCCSQELMSRRSFLLNDLLERAESKTRDMNVRLEQMVQERTRELSKTNQELRTSIQREKTMVDTLAREEKKLQKSLKSLEQAEAIAKLGYFERNWETDTGYWSKGFFSLMGVEHEMDSLPFETFIDSIDADDRQRVINHIQESIANYEPMDIEFRLTQQDGNRIQIHGIADHFYFDDDRPVITRGVFQDITDRKQAEVLLKKLEAQLIHAQKMESVGRLAGGVAHDYNNISSIVIGETVLLVEDDAVILKMCRSMLERLGYVVLSANTPGEALRIVEQGAVKITLLISDVVMPEMNGRELADRLQSLCPGLKALFMSGYTAKIIAQRGVLEAGVHFIPKPFSRKDLAVSVRRVLDER